MDKNISRIVYLLGGIILLGIFLSQFIEIDEFKNVIDNLFRMRTIKM